MARLKSLREYIDALKAIGELQEIDPEVDWNLEIGAISRRCYETGAPAPLFNTIKGIEKGFRVLGAPAGVSRQPGLYLSRIAVSLGLPPESRGREIVEALVAARGREFIPPKLVTTGACKENILTSDDVDLLRLPTPLLHGGDGGRYLNTYGIFVVRTPNQQWTSWLIARAMLLDKNRMAGIVASNQRIGMVRQTWTNIGKSQDEKMSMHTTKVIYNCLPPDEWGDQLPQRSSFAGIYPQELQDKVLKNWQAYGFR